MDYHHRGRRHRPRHHHRGRRGRSWITGCGASRNHGGAPRRFGCGIVSCDGRIHDWKTDPKRCDQTGCGCSYRVCTQPRPLRLEAATTTSFDLVIRGGTILDGTGGPPWSADLGIVGDTIRAIGTISPEQGATTIDAAGKMVSPGFIDIHSHSDRSILRYPTAPSRVHDGITTEVTGNCGIVGRADLGPGKRAGGQEAIGGLRNRAHLGRAWRATSRPSKSWASR